MLILLRRQFFDSGRLNGGETNMCLRAIIFCAALMLRLSSRAFSESRGTVEEVALTHVANAMSAYRIVHGQLPAKWEQIGTVIELDAENRPLNTAYGFRIQDRYQFVNQKLPLLDPLQSEVLMIRVSPFKDYRANQEIFRTLIYRTKDGVIMAGVFPEEQVRKAMRAANFQIAQPSGVADLESNVNRSASTLSPPDASEQAQVEAQHPLARSVVSPTPIPTPLQAPSPFPESTDSESTSWLKATAFTVTIAGTASLLLLDRRKRRKQ